MTAQRRDANATPGETKCDGDRSRQQHEVRQRQLSGPAQQRDAAVSHAEHKRQARDKRLANGLRVKPACEDERCAQHDRRHHQQH